jgi:hypothetical protein
MAQARRQASSHDEDEVRDGDSRDGGGGSLVLYKLAGLL